MQLCRDASNRVDFNNDFAFGAGAFFANGQESNKPVGQECLAGYSLLGEELTYLGEDQDIVFYGLKSNTAGTKQLWVRLELGPEAQEKLQKARPAGNSRQDALANIRTVLCRVQADSVKGNCLVVEQIWLDDSERIIGCQTADEEQDAGWPANYIGKICKEFLEGWLTFGSITAQKPQNTGSTETSGRSCWKRFFDR